MSRQNLILVLLLTILLPAVPLVAQTSNSRTNPHPAEDLVGLQENLIVGGRVKLNMVGPGPKEIQGVLVGMESSELLISPEGHSDVVRVETDRVWRVQVPGGERRRALKGLGLGAGGGALLGVVLGLASGDDPDSCWLICYTAGEKAALAGASLGIIGGVVGLIAGGLTKETVWNDVAVAAMRTSINPSPAGGVEFRLTLPTGRK
jgi:hypothetical protein